MHLRFLTLCLSALLLGSLVAHAQNTQNPDSSLLHINGVETPQIPVTGSALNNSNPDLNGLKVVQKYPEPKMFTISTSQSMFWTDNAFVTNGGQVGSFGYNGRLAATYVPYSTYNWTPSISFEQQFIRYDHTPGLNFDAQTVRLSSKYDLNESKSWSSLTSYSLQRLYSGGDNAGEFYKESNLQSEIDYVHTIFGQKNLFFTGSYNIAWRLTDPGYYNQVDNSLLFSIVYIPVQNLRLQAYARPSIACYTDNVEINPTTNVTHNQGRTDYNASLGALACYYPFKQVSLTANFNWVGNYSNLGDREYRTISPALTLSGSYGF